MGRNRPGRTPGAGIEGHIQISETGVGAGKTRGGAYSREGKSAAYILLYRYFFGVCAPGILRLV